MEESGCVIEGDYVFYSGVSKNSSKKDSNVLLEKEKQEVKEAVERRISLDFGIKEHKKQRGINNLNKKVLPVISTSMFIALGCAGIGTSIYLWYNDGEIKDLFQKTYINYKEDGNVKEFKTRGIGYYTAYYKQKAFKEAYSKSIELSRKKTAYSYKQLISLDKRFLNREGFLKFYFDSQFWKGINHMTYKDKDFKTVGIFKNCIYMKKVIML